MDMDAVHENSFSDQMMMPTNVPENDFEVNGPYEASSFSYDELFPSLPENELKPEVPSVPMGQWNQKMKMKSSVITQVFRVPVEERRFRELNNQRFGEQGEQAKICGDIMQKTEAHIEISSSKDQSLTILITGKEEAVLKARRLVTKELQTQANTTISIPKEHHRYILGKGGKKLLDLELSTATKISVPRSDENSDVIRITGTKEGIDKARHEIQLISDEQGKLAFERLHIEKEFHPFIMGPNNETLAKIVSETGARVNIPPISVMKDELTIAGEKEAVAQAKARIEKIHEERRKRNQTVCIEVPKKQHKYIIGRRGETIQEIFAETGVYVEMPPTDKESDTITLRGDQQKLGPALTLVYSKANSVKTENMDVPTWLHKYIIGKKGANIRNVTQELTKVQIDFIEDRVKIEGPPEEVAKACSKLKEIIDDLTEKLSFAEIRIKPSFHRHIIGKSGANINRLKEETKTIINIPSDGINDVIRIEGPAEGVAQVKKELLEKSTKMENEVTKELKIEQRFHRNIIGAKGETIRDIKDKFNQVNITFPEAGLKSDKVTVRGPKKDVDACCKHLQQLFESLKVNNFSVDVPIYKQNHKFIIGKGGSKIKSIREETDTKIDLPGEGDESDVIVIRGKKENVLKAENMLLKIQEELTNVVTQEIIIPHKQHNSIIGKNGKLIRSIMEECGGVNIKFPSEGANSDKVSIRGPKDDVKKAKDRLLEISSEKTLVGHVIEIKANPEQHRFLIGKSGVNIKKVRDKTNARIVFPNENDEDKHTITIIGRKEDAEAAKKELEAIIAQLANTSEMTVEIDPKHHKHFVARRAELLKTISDDFGGVTVSFPRQGTASSTVTLKGAKDCLEGARNRLLEIVQDLEAQVTVQVSIPQEHHRTLLGPRGIKVQAIQNEHKVQIKFPDRRPQDESDRGMMNGDCHGEGSDAESNVKDIITVKGRPENCKAAEAALRDLVPVVGEVQVPYDLHRFIIGQKGKDLRAMMEEYDVNISIPPQSEHSDTITVKGTPLNVERTREALRERVEQLEKEKEERVLRSYQTTVEVPLEYHPKIIGRRGEVINRIRKDHGVIINLPDRDPDSQNVITIMGYERDAEAAKAAIQKLVEDQENLHKEDVRIDSRVHPRIIGQKGRAVSRLMEEFKVDIRFSRNPDTPDMVTIQGEREHVLEAKDELLNLEEEYLQDVVERENMRQYTLPPSRSNGTVSENVFDRGFVVKGAPWDKKGAAPDTTNTQEFPSFGANPGAAAPPAAPVIWGPSRR